MYIQIIWRIYQLESCIAHESVPQVDTFFVFSMERDIPHRDTPGIFLFIHVNSKYFNFLPNNAISFQISNFYSKKYFVVQNCSCSFKVFSNDYFTLCCYQNNKLFCFWYVIFCLFVFSICFCFCLFLTGFCFFCLFVFLCFYVFLFVSVFFHCFYCLLTLSVFFCFFWFVPIFRSNCFVFFFEYVIHKLPLPKLPLPMNKLPKKKRLSRNLIVICSQFP